LAPFVFTNVEEHMVLARKTRPAPVLALLREDGAASGGAAAGNGGL
jgi:hypothetical protein